MLKITAILSLMFIVSSVWSACDSCGSECASACGTRRFRTCCFNYLRRKRVPQLLKLHSFADDVRESQPKSEQPIFVFENIPTPEQWVSNVLASGNHPSSLEDMFDNQLE